jgi:hypothetical protein
MSSHLPISPAQPADTRPELETSTHSGLAVVRLRTKLRSLVESGPARYVFLFAIFFSLLFLRRWAQLLHPQVWDEDGTQILIGFVDHGFKSLAYPVNGYLILVPKLISLVSLSVSGLYYPLISTIITWIFIVCICVAIAVSPTWLRGGTLLAIAVLLVPSDPEVFGIPLYTFWWAGLLLFIVALWDEDSNDLKFRLPFVLLGGLSSPLIFVATPFLLIRALLFKAKRREVAVLVTACLCCLAQAIAMHRELSKITTGKIDANNLRLVLPKFLGCYLVGNFRHTGNNLLWFAAGFLIAFFIAAAGFIARQPRYWFLAGLWFGSVVLIAARVDLSILQPRVAGPRYFFVPFVLLSWYLLAIVLDSSLKNIRWTAAALLFLSLLNCLPVLSRPQQDFQWAAHLSSCGRFEHYGIPISYDGRTEWFMDVSRNQCEVLQHSGLFTLRHSLNARSSYPYSIKPLPTGPLDASGFAAMVAVVSGQGFKVGASTTTIPGFTVITPEFQDKDNVGRLTLQLHKGDKVLFRAGSSPNRQHISIQGRNEFLTSLTPTSAWAILEFSNDLLPEEFRVTFSGDGASGSDNSPVIALCN